MSESGKKRGRPRKQPVAYNADAVKEFIAGEYQYYVDKKELQENHKDFRDAYADRVDGKLIQQIIKAVKLRYDMEKLQASQETVDDIASIVEETFGGILNRGDDE